MAQSKAYTKDLMKSFLNLSRDELRDLCDDKSDEKYDKIVNQSKSVLELEQDRAILMESLKSLAQSNLSQQKDYERDRAILMDLIIDCNSIRENINTKMTKLKGHQEKISRGYTLKELSIAATRVEDESETMAKAFLDHRLDYDDFLKEFPNKRKLLHIRRIKADKLHQDKRDWMKDLNNL